MKYVMIECKEKLLSIRYILFGIIFLPLALDFRSKFTDPSFLSPIIQIIFTSLTIFSCIGLLFLFLTQRSYLVAPSHAISPALKLWVLFLLLSAITALLNAVPVETFARTMLPFILAWIGMLAVYFLAVQGYKPEAILKLIVATSFVTIIWQVLLELGIRGTPIDNIRFHIIGAGLPIVTAYSIALLVFSRGRNIIGILGMLIVSTIIFLSVTRGLLISVVLSFIAAIAIHFQSLTIKKLMQRLVPSFVAAMVILSIMLYASYLFGSDVFQNWIVRIFEQRTDSGVDVTSLARIAEYSSQMALLTQDPITLFFGRGYGSSYNLDMNIAYELEGILSQDIMYSDHIALGHSLWVFSLFTGGLLSGWILPFVMVAATIKAWNASKCTNIENSSDYIINMTIFLALFQIALSAFAGHPFSLRYLAICIGALIALAYWISKSKKVIRNTS